MSGHFSASILASRPSAKGETTKRPECTSAVGGIIPPITMSHFLLTMMSYYVMFCCCEMRFCKVKIRGLTWVFDMALFGDLKNYFFLSCRKRPGCCGPPLWQVIMEFGRFLTKNQFYLWSFFSGPFVVTLQCFSCTIPSSLLLCVQAFL